MSKTADSDKYSHGDFKARSRLTGSILRLYVVEVPVLPDKTALYAPTTPSRGNPRRRTFSVVTPWHHQCRYSTIYSINGALSIPLRTIQSLQIVQFTATSMPTLRIFNVYIVIDLSSSIDKTIGAAAGGSGGTLIKLLRINWNRVLM